MNICEYGCGQEAKYQFKNGKWCCNDKWQKCPSKKKQITNYLKSYKEKKNKKEDLKNDEEDLETLNELNKELKEDLQKLNKINISIKEVKEDLEILNDSTEINNCTNCTNTECHCNTSKKSDNINIHKIINFTKSTEDETPISNDKNEMAEIFNNVVIPKSKPIEVIKQTKKEFFLIRLIKRIFKRK